MASRIHLKWSVEARQPLHLRHHIVHTCSGLLRASRSVYCVQILSELHRCVAAGISAAAARDATMSWIRLHARIPDHWRACLLPSDLSDATCEEAGETSPGVLVPILF